MRRALLLLLAATSAALAPQRRTTRRSVLPPAVAVAFLASRADAALVCIDGQGPWCDGLERAKNPRAEEAAAANAAAYEAELARASDAIRRRRPLPPTEAATQDAPADAPADRSAAAGPPP